MTRLSLPHWSVPILLGLLLTLGAGQGLAQPPGRGAERSPGALAPNEIQRLFDAYEGMQAREALALGEAQLPSFLAQLTLLQETRRRNQQARNRIIQKLSRLSGQRGELDEAGVRSAVTELAAAEEGYVAEARKACEAPSNPDLRQQARFRSRGSDGAAKLDLLMRARRRAARGTEPIK
jgi:hypothetical protein